jgi:NAD(P)-dependent dehydrogenase (short-subunit alcohol dehydrogenase family)
MSNSLDGKSILVIGASGAQGSVTAKLLADEGANLVLADTSKEGLEATRVFASGGAGNVLTKVCDISKESDWIELVRFGVENFGKITGLVNFAAVLSRPGIEETTLESWERTIQVNQTGAWLGMKAVIPALRAAQGGSIVNIGSVDALVGRGGGAAYQSSKGGLRLLSASAATQYAHEGIRVNCVHPGPMESRMTQVIGPKADLADTKKLEDKLRSQIPMGRLGRPIDIAYAVRYFLSDESAFVTGCDLAVDGGLTAQ